jgi:hypothetical protein
MVSGQVQKSEPHNYTKVFLVVKRRVIFIINEKLSKKYTLF